MLPANLDEPGLSCQRRRVLLEDPGDLADDSLCGRVFYSHAVPSPYEDHALPAARRLWRASSVPSLFTLCGAASDRPPRKASLCPVGAPHSAERSSTERSGTAWISGMPQRPLRAKHAAARFGFRVRSTAGGRRGVIAPQQIRDPASSGASEWRESSRSARQRAVASSWLRRAAEATRRALTDATPRSRSGDGVPLELRSSLGSISIPAFIVDPRPALMQRRTSRLVEDLWFA